MLGPPAVGKSLVVKQLCERYKLHHLTIAKVIQDSIDRLVGGRKEGREGGGRGQEG